MTHLIKSTPLPCQPLRRRRSRRAKLLLLLPLAGLVLACSSCSDEVEPKPQPVIPESIAEPVGEGLSVIGFAVLGSAVVIVLGRLLG